MITLRSATHSDLDLLRHWDTQPHVIASNPNDEWDWKTELRSSPDWREMLIAELAGRPIGFIQIIDPAREESRYWGNIDTGYLAIDIWIGEESDLGKGYGTEMMNLTLDKCFANPEVKAILIDPLASNKRAHSFYKKLGFRFVERRRFGDDNCYVYRLNRQNWIPAH